MGVDGNMYGWIRDFLCNRSISVQINTSFLDKFVLTMVCLKAVLLVARLFKIMGNDLIDLN